jgi:hypothetical protein
MAVYSPSGSGQVHVDKILTQLSIEFPIDMNFAGEVLFPSVKVLKQSDKYYLFDRETTKLELHDVRAPGTVANEIPGRQLSSDSYYASEHALQIPVTDEERQNVDNPLTPDRDAAELVTKRILLGREKAMKDMATTAANYAAGHSVTLAGANQWDVPNYATSNPIADVQAVHASEYDDHSVAGHVQPGRPPGLHRADQVRGARYPDARHHRCDLRSSEHHRAGRWVLHGCNGCDGLCGQHHVLVGQGRGDRMGASGYSQYAERRLRRRVQLVVP